MCQWHSARIFKVFFCTTNATNKFPERRRSCHVYSIVSSRKIGDQKHKYWTTIDNIKVFSQVDYLQRSIQALFLTTVLWPNFQIGYLRTSLYCRKDDYLKRVLVRGWFKHLDRTPSSPSRPFNDATTRHGAEFHTRPTRSTSTPLPPKKKVHYYIDYVGMLPWLVRPANA